MDAKTILSHYFLKHFRRRRKGFLRTIFVVVVAATLALRVLSVFPDVAVYHSHGGEIHSHGSGGLAHTHGPDSDGHHHDGEEHGHTHDHVLTHEAFWSHLKGTPAPEEPGHRPVEHSAPTDPEKESDDEPDTPLPETYFSASVSLFDVDATQPVLEPPRHASDPTVCENRVIQQIPAGGLRARAPPAVPHSHRV